MPETAFIPVNVITGFLGSGKTTLLQRLLGSPGAVAQLILGALPIGKREAELCENEIGDPHAF